MNLFLIYVNYIGKDHKSLHLYEFIFSDKTTGVEGTDWDTYPASGRPEPPNEIFIKKVLLLKSELILDVIQNSDTFAVWDAMDGVIALAWENINAYETYPEHRLCFRFGEPLEIVNNKIFEKELAFENEKEKR